jgi:biotin transporter BioY
MTLSSIVVTLAPPATRASARAAYAAVAVVAGSVAIALLAQMSIRLPFTPIPITGQTLGVLVVGAALGPGLGALTLARYLLEAGLHPFIVGDTFKLLIAAGLLAFAWRTVRRLRSPTATDDLAPH